MASPLWQVRLADDEKLFNALDANSQKVADRDLVPISDTTVLTTALMPAVVTSSSAAAEEAAEAKAAAAAEAMAVAMSNASADETFVRKRAPPSNVLHTAPSPTIARKQTTDSPVAVTSAVMSAVVTQAVVYAAAPAEEASTEAFTEAFTEEGAPDEATGEGPTPRMKGTRDLARSSFSR